MQFGESTANGPTPNPSPLERGVITLASCWRTGHGDPSPTWLAHLFYLFYLCSFK